MKKNRTPTLPLLAVYLLVAGALNFVGIPAAHAADMHKAMQVQLDPSGPDEAWEISSKMEMQGMAMPAQTQKACLAKTDPKGMPPEQDKNCKVTDHKVSGNKTTVKMQCSGKEPMTAELETTSSATAFSSIMKMKMKDGSMTVNSSGKLIGRCDKSQQDKKLKAAVDATVDEGCKKMMQMYLFDGFNKQCAHRKTEFCNKLKTDLSAPDSYDKTMSEVHDKTAFAAGAAQVCALDSEKSRAANCKTSSDKKSWKFVAKHCPAETEVLGAKHCGVKTLTRDYTAVRVLAEPEYAPICSKRAAGNKPAAGTAASTPVAAPAETKAKAAPARKESSAAASSTPAQAPAAAPEKKKEQGTPPEEAAKALQKLFKF